MINKLKRLFCNHDFKLKRKYPVRDFISEKVKWEVQRECAYCGRVEVKTFKSRPRW